MSAAGCDADAALQARTTWISHSGLMARPLTPLFIAPWIHMRSRRCRWEGRWAWVLEVVLAIGRQWRIPAFSARNETPSQCGPARFSTSLRQSKCFEAVSDLVKSNASLLLEKQRLSVSKYFHWFSPGLCVVQTCWRETPVPPSYSSGGSINHRRTLRLLVRPMWWMTRRWESMSEGQSMVWAAGYILLFPSTLLLTASEFPIGTPWKGSSKQCPVISGASKHQSQSNSWTSTLPLVPGSLRAAGLCCLLFMASCLSHLWSCSVFTVKLFIQCHIVCQDLLREQRSSSRRWKQRKNSLWLPHLSTACFRQVAQDRLAASMYKKRYQEQYVGKIWMPPKHPFVVGFGW